MALTRDPLIEKWRRFRMRPRADRKLILLAALILPLTEIGLRLFGFRRWKELIEKFSLQAAPLQSMPADSQRETALRAVRALRSAELHGLTNPNCLERSLTLWWILRRDGVDSELRIGGRKKDGRFEAHAWVELRGEVLNDSPEVHEHYSRFDAPLAAERSESRTDVKRESNSAGNIASR